MPGWLDRCSASRCAVALCWWTRAASVRMPRSPFQASNGEAWAPWTRCQPQTASMSSRPPAITPSRASLCPAMPLVAAWSTRSAPSDSGCWTTGVAKVESTTVNGPGTAATASMSVSVSAGLAGVSTKTSWVLPGRTASTNCWGSVPSTNVTSMPSRGQWAPKKVDVAENVCRCATTWSPVEHSPSTVVVTAAMPEGNGTGASDAPPWVRPAVIARVSIRSSSAMSGLHFVQELPDDAGELVGLDEEGVVAMGAVELGIAGGHALRRRELDDLPRLMGRVQDVAVDAHRQQRRPQPGEGRPVAAPSPGQVVEVHGLGQDQVAVGVEAPHQLVTLVFEVALDLEALPQREPVDRLHGLAPEPRAEHVVATERHHRHHPGRGQPLVRAVTWGGVVVVAAAPPRVHPDGPPPAAPPADLLGARRRCGGDGDQRPHHPGVG